MSTALSSLAWDEATNTKTVQCERLEYGKFVDSVAESMEHRILAKSANFPAALLRFCGPPIIGPSLRDQEPTPSWAPHGTVLQPVAIGNKVVGVFARVKPLPEGALGRDYQRARYVEVPEGGVGPLAIYSAMGLAEEFVSLSKKDASEAGGRLMADPALTWRRGYDIRADFLNKAIEFILSGTSVAISGEIKEELFFAYADAIWSALPKTVQPWFSAGWGVAASLSGQVAFSAGAAGNEWTARYSYQEQIWTSVPDNDETETELARGYLTIYFRGDASHSQRSQRELQEKLKLVGDLCSPIAPSDEVLRWSTPKVRGVFQSVGRAAADAWRIERIKEALDSGTQEELEPESLGELLWLDVSRKYCVQGIADGLANPETAVAAALALELWGEYDPELLEKAQDEAHPFLARFIALSKADPVRVLRDLANESEAAGAEWNAFERHARVVAMRRGLNAFDEDQMKLHGDLLRLEKPPDEYSFFLHDNGWNLALAIDELALNQSAEALTRVAAREIRSKEPVQELCRLAKYEKSDAEFAKQLKSSPLFLEAFQKRIGARWQQIEELSRTEQDNLLDWAVELRVPHLPVVDAVVKGGAPERNLTTNEVRLLAAEVCGRRVPRTAEVAVSKIVLNQIDTFIPEILPGPLFWQRIAEPWPSQIQRLLGIQRQGSHGIPPELNRIRPATIEEILQKWTSEWSRLLDQATAGDLLDLAEKIEESNSNKEAAPVAYLAGRIKRVQLAGYATVNPVSPEQIERAARLVLAGKIRFSVASAKLAWESAETPLALLLLLRLAPDHDFEPTQKQNERLSKVRGTLQRYLAEDGTSEERQMSFWLAAAEFHQYAYREDIYPGPDTPLWAVFSGVPIERQKVLVIEALDHFTGHLQEHQRPRAKVALAKKYLEGMSVRPPGEGEMAARRVHSQLIVKEIVARDVGYYSQHHFWAELSKVRETYFLKFSEDSDSRNLISCYGSGDKAQFRVEKSLMDLFESIRKIDYAMVRR